MQLSLSQRNPSRQGHLMRPQSPDSVSPGHSLPSPADWTSTALSLLLLPPPQVALQVLQELHWLTLQSTGHVVMPHSSDSVSPGHSCPPLAGGVFTVLPLCLLPPPQVALQAPQELHWLTLQSTGERGGEVQVENGGMRKLPGQLFCSHSVHSSLPPGLVVSLSEWKIKFTVFVMLVKFAGMVEPQVFPSNSVPSPSFTMT